MVLDSVGIGEAPDASDFGDCGANTLAHVAEAVGGLHLPVLHGMGLGNIPSVIPGGLPIPGMPPVSKPICDYGALMPRSKGKDTMTGHWELTGIKLEHAFRVFPPDHPSFPMKLISEFEKRTGRRVLGNKAASGTAIIEELGAEQMASGSWIVYTSADSVFQIAAHEEIIPPEELYRACEIARELCNEHGIGRVIARPYIGAPGSFRRTKNRRDYSHPLPQPTILDRLHEAGIDVYAVGKIDDIFNKSGIKKSFHTSNNAESQAAVIKLLKRNVTGLIFANLIDFDMLFGHRRDAIGYAKALEQTDCFLASILPMLGSNDILMITADHGNDPTFKGTDHTREYVPLLLYRLPLSGRNLGVRRGFFDVSQSLASFFGIPAMPLGVSFIVRKQ